MKTIVYSVFAQFPHSQPAPNMPTPARMPIWHLIFYPDSLAVVRFPTWYCSSHHHCPGSPPHKSPASSPVLRVPRSPVLWSGWVEDEDSAMMFQYYPFRSDFGVPTYWPDPPFSPGLEIRSPPSSTGISRLSPAPEAAEPTLMVLPGNLSVTLVSMPDSVAGKVLVE